MSQEYLKKKFKKMMPDFLKEMAKDYGFYIAGGAITSLVTRADVNDYDVYIKKGVDIFSFLRDISNTCTLISTTPKSIFVNHSGAFINIIFMDVYENSQEIFDSFDFTCCMGIYDINEDKFIFHNDFLLHNSQRILMFNSKTPYPLMSAFRIKKYEKRGFTISKNEFLRIMLSINNINISSYEELAAQIGGLYGIEIDKIFDTEKPFNLDYVIQQISEFDFEYDYKSKDPSLSIVSEAIYKLYEKRGATLTRIPIITFNKGCIKERHEFLGINGFICYMPNHLKATELPEQIEGIKVLCKISKNNNSTYKVERNPKEIRVGDIIEAENPKDVFYCKTYNDLTDWWGSYYGIFEIQNNFIEGVTGQDITSSGIKVLKMKLLEVINHTEKQDTHDYLMGIDF